MYLLFCQLLLPVISQKALLNIKWIKSCSCFKLFFGEGGWGPGFNHSGFKSFILKIVTLQFNCK